MITTQNTTLQSSRHTINQFSILRTVQQNSRVIVVTMVGCFPSTPKKWALTIACFLFGAATMAVGAHLSYVNIEPQRARTLARDKLVLDKLRKKYGYIPPSEVRARRMARSDSPKEHN